MLCFGGGTVECPKFPLLFTLNKAKHPHIFCFVARVFCGHLMLYYTLYSVYLLTGYEWVLVV